MPNWSDDEGRCHCEFCDWKRDPTNLKPTRQACIKAPREVPSKKIVDEIANGSFDEVASLADAYAEEARQDGFHGVGRDVATTEARNAFRSALTKLISGRSTPQETRSTSPRSPDEQRAYIQGIEFALYVLRAQPPNLFNRTRLMAALELEIKKAKQ